MSIPALAAAVLLGATCTVPFFLWGNPYPEGVVPYWVWGTLTVVGVATLAALLPGTLFADFPGRARALLDRPSPSWVLHLVRWRPSGLWMPSSCR